jgi:hypothetical protein
MVWPIRKVLNITPTNRRTAVTVVRIGAFRLIKEMLKSPKRK